MAAAKTTPHLTWPGKQPPGRPMPAMALVEVPALSYQAGPSAAANMLIHGDNLPALAALAATHAGQVKCIYIDPPFNTKQSLQFYGDDVEHAAWLQAMYERLAALHVLLAADGAIFVHIDDNELGYLIVLLDEVFGRHNRISTVTFKQGSATGHKAINPGCVTTSNFIVIYAKDRAMWAPKRLFTARARDVRYNRFVCNRAAPPVDWQIVPLIKAYAQHTGKTHAEARAQIRQTPEALDEFVVTHAASVIRLARPNYNAISIVARAAIDMSRAEPRTIVHLERPDHNDFYLLGGERILFYQDKLKQVDGVWTAAEPLTTIWDDIASNNLHKEGGVVFPKGKKPEALLKRILELSTDPGDLVLDAFAGSGTTGAVAHKLGRRWLMIESGDQAISHIIPRLKAVIDGQDAGGIGTNGDWRGDGFAVYRVEKGRIAGESAAAG